MNPYVSGATGAPNIPMCFTLEDSKISPGTGRNMVRTLKGCIPDTVRIIATQGEKVRIECDYMGQWLDYTSGATTGITVPTTLPYMWNNCTLTLSGATANSTYAITTAKDVTFEIRNNLTGPHYINGSRDIDAPIVGNKDYLLTTTFDMRGDQANLLYSGLYKRNTNFNVTFDLNGDNATTGSLHTIFFMSGCQISSMDVPSEIEGTAETTMEIIPKIVVGSAFDPTLKYNPW
jgi:hypothetical protein